MSSWLEIVPLNSPPGLNVSFVHMPMTMFIADGWFDKDKRLGICTSSYKSTMGIGCRYAAPA